MSATGPELSALAVSASLCLVGAGFLAPAMRAARRALPPRSPADPGWRPAEVGAVVATPIVLLSALAALLPHVGHLAGLFATQAALIAAAALVLARARALPGRRESLGLLVRAPVRAYLAAALVYLALYPLMMGLGGLWTGLARRLGWSTEQQVLRLILELGPSELVLTAGLAIVVGPLLEEFLFRGFLQAALAGPLGERGGLFLSSALFAALHLDAPVPALFALSLLLGWLQQRTRCLWIPCSVHALNNAVTLALALTLGPGPESDP